MYNTTEYYSVMKKKKQSHHTCSSIITLTQKQVEVKRHQVKEVNTKDYVLHYFVYMKPQKRQNYSDKKQVSNYLRLGMGERINCKRTQENM